MSDPTFHAPLASLYLCPECAHVGADATKCWSCANTAGLLNLSAVLDREPEDEDELLILAAH